MIRNLVATIKNPEVEITSGLKDTEIIVLID
jgi:hypothetical protein